MLPRIDKRKEAMAEKQRGALVSGVRSPVDPYAVGARRERRDSRGALPSPLTEVPDTAPLTLEDDATPAAAPRTRGARPTEEEDASSESTTPYRTQRPRGGRIEGEDDGVRRGEFIELCGMVAKVAEEVEAILNKDRTASVPTPRPHNFAYRSGRR